MLKFSVSNLHADSLAAILSGTGPWPVTSWRCRIISRDDDDQFGSARLATTAPRDAIEAAMLVIRENDDRCSAIDYESHDHGVSSSTGGPLYVDPATVYSVVQRCECGSTRELQGPDSSRLHVHVDWR